MDFWRIYDINHTTFYKSTKDNNGLGGYILFSILIFILSLTFYENFNYLVLCTTGFDTNLLMINTNSDIEFSPTSILDYVNEDFTKSLHKQVYPIDSIANLNSLGFFKNINIL